MKKIMIEVGGKVYPCHLTMGAMLLFKQNTGHEMAEIDAQSIEEMLMMLWCCIVSTCRGDHIDFEISFEEFADLVTPETIGQWNQAMGDASEQQKKNGALSSDGEDDAEPATIERLLGIAMGCMGMSMMDFCRCVPSVFYAAYEAWHEMQEQREQAQWERMRMQCLCSLQPYTKDRLRPRDVMQFPWEEPRSGLSEEGRVKSEETRFGDRRESQFSCPASEHGELSHEELMARYREARERFGLN